LLRALSRHVALSGIGVAFLATEAPAQFVDRTSAVGLSRLGASWSAIFVDLDRDGDLDLYSGHHAEEPTLYGNDGSGHFNTFSLPQPWTGPLDRHGAIILSLDEDQDAEILILHGGEGGTGPEPNELYRNDGGAFAEGAAAAGLDDPEGRSRAVSAADFDGDGRVDLWIGKAPSASSPNSLLRNGGALSFSDVAAAAGLDEQLGTVGGIWGDVDDDGDPDLLVGGEEFARPTILFRNDGGVFADASAIFTPPLPVVSGADFGDFDDDGDLDFAACDGSLGIFDVFAEGDTVSFFFTTRHAENGVDGLTIPSTADTMLARLRVRAWDDSTLVFLGPQEVHPDLPPPFVLTDAYVGAPAFTPGVDRGIWVWRTSPGGPWEVRCSSPLVNADAFDGWLTDGSTIAGVAPHDLEDPGFAPGRPRVWRNDGAQFAEVTAQLGLPVMLNPRDVSWVDYDNDGDLDLHVVDMGTSAAPNAPDALFRNDGAAFADVTALEGMAGGTAGLGDGAVWGDVDDDGDLDLYVQQGAGPLAFGESGPTLFLDNSGARGNAIELDLAGDASGPTAVGARVTAWTAGSVVRRRVSANSWRGFADPATVHLGLGVATAAESLTVEWPAGGVETYFHVAAREYRLREGRQVSAPSILTASPDSIAPTQTGFLTFEVNDSTGTRVSGEAPNFTLTSLAGLLVPGVATENADSTYAFSYESGAAVGADTLVVTDALSWPPRSDSLEVWVAIYPDTIRVAADGPSRVHWNESLSVRVSILDPNGNRLPDGGVPFEIDSLAGLGTLGPRTQEPDTSWTLVFVAGGGAGVAVDTLVASDPEAVAVDADSLAVEITDRAIVESVADVENDQGRQVRVTWQRDLRDTTGAATPITHYAVWRRLGQSAIWQPVGSIVPAATLPAYDAVVPTIADSTGFGGIRWSVFRVRAHTAAPAVFFDSAPDSGWSVDNLAPGPPGPVAFTTPERIEWEAPIDPNWSYFTVYASEEPDFGTATALGVTTALTWEPVPAPFAFVTAVDLAGNESEPSATANPTPSPDGLGIAPLTFLGGGRPNPFRESVGIDFGLARPDVATLVVYDVRGRRVRVLREGPAAPGRHVETWNGLDAAGRQVVPGVYFVSFESGAFRSTRKIVRLR
jgi:hypothetical protein